MGCGGTINVEDAMTSTLRFALALPFLTVAVLFSVPSALCMYAAGLIEGKG